MGLALLLQRIFVGSSKAIRGHSAEIGAAGTSERPESEERRNAGAEETMKVSLFSASLGDPLPKTIPIS